MHTPPASRSKPTPTHELPFGATLRKLLLIIPASFALPVIVLLLIASYLSNTVGPNPDSSPMSTRAIVRRIAPVAQLVVASGPRMAEKWNAASLSAAAPTPNAQAKTPATAHAPVGGTSASAMLTLARRKNCLTCHTADHKVVGPAYEAVAEKYAGKPGAEQMLVNAVLHGHVGTWGQVPMPAEPGTNSIELPSAYFDFPMSNAMTLAEPIDYAELICELVRKRQQTSPKRLGEPGPDAGQVRELFTAAAQAPDHGLILPWRFVHVSDAGRQRLGEAFVQALLERDPDATAQQRSEARAKAARAPFLALAIARPHDDASPEIPPRERLVSLGCALQNMLLLAHAQGFGAGLVSGQAMESRALRDLFRLADNEQAVCFIAVGTVAKAKTSRVRPSPVDFVETL